MGCLTSSELALLPLNPVYAPKDITFQEFVERIRGEIEKNSTIYANILPTTYILQILNETQKRFIEHNQTQQLVRMVLQFLSYCKNQWGCQPKLPTTFTDNFQKELALWWNKIRNPIFIANKSHLRILSFILQSPQSGTRYYQGHFRQYKMDLSEESVAKMAEIGLLMAREHTSSSAFLTNFLWGSCLHLSDSGVSTQQIRERYQRILKDLYDKYRPAPKIWDRQEQMNIHESFKKPELIPKLTVDLCGKQDKDKVLNDFIMERAAESKSHYNQFKQLMSEVYQKNGGFHFVSGLKIKDRSEIRALLRIKQKMLKDIYQSEQELVKTIGDSKLRSKNQLSIREMVTEQRRKYEEKLRSLYQNMKEPLQFKVSDMLRGKCLFASVQKINECCTDLKEKLSQEQYKHLKLIEIDNRLQGETSDIVLKILFGNVIAEMQLRINLSDSDYSFAHKIYELGRSKFFSPLTQLSIMNEDLSDSYFTQAKAYINGNIRDQQGDYEETTTFKEVSLHFSDFLKQLPVKANTQTPFQKQVDFSLLGQHLTMFTSLKKANKNFGAHLEQPSWMKKKKQGEYLYEMKDYQKSYNALNQAINIMQEKQIYQKQEDTYFQLLNTVGELLCEKGDYTKSMEFYQKINKLFKRGIRQESQSLARMFNNIGSVFDNQGNYQKALQNYQRCLEIKERIKGKGSIDTASTLNNIGLIFNNQGNYQKALQNYQRCLEIQERIKGKGSIDTASTLNNIGLAFNNQGNYEKALQNYQRCLEIKQKTKGKGSIDIAGTLNNIGLIFNNQGNYQKALQNYQRCREIEERIKGKGSIDTASTLNNIGLVFKNQGNYEKALQNYERCLEIQERIKGKGSIDTAVTLNNIGLIFNNQGNYQKAHQNYQRCLEIQERIKGKESIDTAFTLNNIGSVFNSQGNYEKALQNYQRCLEIQERIKGKGSIDTASTLNNIGLIFNNQGNYQKALQNYQRCLEIKERIKGKGSIDTASTLNNIGLVFKNQGNYQKALQNYQRCLEIQERIKGKGSIDTASTLNNIGLVIDSQGNYQKALQNYQRCLEIEERIKGRGSIDTAGTLNNIGLIFNNQGNYQKALQNYQRCLEIQERIKGKGSIDIAGTLNNIGLIFNNQGNYEKALQNYQRCLEIKERIKGKGSIDTASTLNNIGLVFKNQGNYQKALQNYQRCLEIEERIKGKGSIDTASTLYNIALLHKFKGNYEKSVDYFLSSLSICQRFGHKNGIKQVATFLSESYFKLNQTQKLEQLLKKYGLPHPQ